MKTEAFNVEGCSFRPEVADSETWTNSFIEERHTIVKHSQCVSLDDTKHGWMKGTTLRVQEIRGAAHKGDEPHEPWVQHGKNHQAAVFSC